MNVLCCGLFPALQRTLHLDGLCPGAVHRVRSVDLSTGGKATNAARVLKTLGADPLLLGFAGGPSGNTIRQLLAAEKLQTELIETRAETRICQTLLADGLPDFTELIEDSPPLGASDWKNLVRAFAAAAEQSDAIIVSGTLPKHAPQDFYAVLLHASSGKPMLIDSSGEPLLAALEHRPTLVKINAQELLRTLPLAADGATPEQHRTVSLETARELIDRGARAVGITDGPRPALLVTPEAAFEYTLPAIPVDSSLGSGDSVNAGTVFALQKGSPLSEAYRFGLACGLSNAMNRLPGTIKLEQIKQLATAIKKTDLRV